MKKKLIVLTIIISILSLAGCRKNKNQCDGINHSSTEWIVNKEASCISEGSKQKVCTECGTVITTAIISKTNHVIVLDDAKEASCELDGLTEGSHCSVCNTVITEQSVIPASGHNYNYIGDSADGSHLLYKCTHCDNQYQTEKGEITPCSNGHSESEWQNVQDSTCTTQGIKHKVCTKCGIELEIQYLSVIEHQLVIDEAVEPICENTGLSEGSHCENCHKVIVSQTEIEALGHEYVIIETVAPTATTEGYITYQCERCDDQYQKSLPTLADYNPSEPTSIYLSDDQTVVENDNGGVLITNNQIKIMIAGEYNITGTLKEGSIIVALNEDDKATLNLLGVNITCSTTHPIFIESGDKVEISAKADTVNYINDQRVVASNEDANGAAVYAKVDLEIKGKGELNVVSTYNNGIGTTKDLEIKNLTLKVNVPNNALKGNDSLTIISGQITAISSSGDALKTENSDISSKGNQRGIITIEDGTINLYAGCDGIDASYDVIINGGIINIYTETFSEYSGDISVTSSSKMYLQLSSRISLSTSNKFSAQFINEDGTTSWSSAVYSPVGRTIYYELTMPSSAKYVKFYVYTSSQTVNQSTSYAYCSDQLTISNSFDTFYITTSNSQSKLISGSWTNYTSQGFGGMPGGGMQDSGNTNSALYSCKGIKADNQVIISGGDISIKSHDDAIHANSDTLLETSIYGIGNITINGGNINLYSDDDAIHADNTLSVNSGNVIISNSYEGLEGNIINIVDGTVQIKALDDGVNAKSILNIKGGLLYLDAGGDGLDSNGNIYMTGGIVLAIGPSNSGNGVLDFDRSFSFSGGLLLAIGASGMNQKPTATSGNTSTTKNISTSTNSYVSVTVNNQVIAVIKVTKSNQNYCVLAYNNSDYPSATVNVSSSNSYSLTNGLYYYGN